MADRKGEQPGKSSNPAASDAGTPGAGTPEADRAPAKAERDARLAEALRANLRRRKQQARDRKPRGGEPGQGS